MHTLCTHLMKTERSKRRVTVLCDFYLDDIMKFLDYLILT